MFATESTEARELLRRCLQSPGEPEHRHVLADHLAERGMYPDQLCDMIRSEGSWWGGGHAGKEKAFRGIHWVVDFPAYVKRFGAQVEFSPGGYDEESLFSIRLGDNAEDLLVCRKNKECDHTGSVGLKTNLKSRPECVYTCRPVSPVRTAGRSRTGDVMAVSFAPIGPPRYSGTAYPGVW